MRVCRYCRQTIDYSTIRGGWFHHKSRSTICDPELVKGRKRTATPVRND